MRRILFWLAWSLVVGLLLTNIYFIWQSSESNSPNPVSTSEQTVEQTASKENRDRGYGAIRTDFLPKTHIDDQASFRYPESLGDLTLISTTDRQLNYKSSNQDVKFVAFSPQSNNLVYSVIEDDLNNLYLQRPNLDWVVIKSYTYVKDENYYFNSYFDKPEFSPQGQAIVISIFNYEYSGVALFNLQTEQKYWTPEVTWGDEIWTFSTPGSYSHYADFYWSDNDQYLVIVSQINRFGGEGSPAIFAVNMSNDQPGSKVAQKIMSTADPIGVVDDNQALFTNITINNDGLAHFTVTNYLVTEHPQQTFFYDIPNFYLYPDKG